MAKRHPKDAEEYPTIPTEHILNNKYVARGVVLKNNNLVREWSSLFRKRDRLRNTFSEG